MSKAIEDCKTIVKEDCGGFVGNFVFKPVDTEVASRLAAEHLSKAGYKTTTLLYSKKIEGTNF